MPHPIRHPTKQLIRRQHSDRRCGVLSADCRKRGLVVKLGSMYPGERCSYADREHALAIVRKDVQHFGLQSLRHYPRRVQELYAAEIAGEA